MGNSNQKLRQKISIIAGSSLAILLFVLVVVAVDKQNSNYLKTQSMSGDQAAQCTASGGTWQGETASPPCLMPNNQQNYQQPPPYNNQPAQPICGNYICESSETATSCPADCGTGGNTTQNNDPATTCAQQNGQWIADINTCCTSSSQVCTDSQGKKYCSSSGCGSTTNYQPSGTQPSGMQSDCTAKKGTWCSNDPYNSTSTNGWCKYEGGSCPTSTSGSNTQPQGQTCTSPQWYCQSKAKCVTSSQECDGSTTSGGSQPGQCPSGQTWVIGVNGGGYCQYSGSTTNNTNTQQCPQGQYWYQQSGSTNGYCKNNDQYNQQGTQGSQPTQCPQGQYWYTQPGSNQGYCKSSSDQYSPQGTTTTKCGPDQYWYQQPGSDKGYCKNNDQKGQPSPQPPEGQDGKCYAFIDGKDQEVTVPEGLECWEAINKLMNLNWPKEEEKNFERQITNDTKNITQQSKNKPCSQDAKNILKNRTKLVDKLTKLYPNFDATNFCTAAVDKVNEFQGSGETDPLAIYNTCIGALRVTKAGGQYEDKREIWDGLNDCRMTAEEAGGFGPGGGGFDCRELWETWQPCEMCMNIMQPIKDIQREQTNFAKTITKMEKQGQDVSDVKEKAEEIFGGVNTAINEDLTSGNCEDLQDITRNFFEEDMRSIWDYMQQSQETARQFEMCKEIPKIRDEATERKADALERLIKMRGEEGKAKGEKRFGALFSLLDEAQTACDDEDAETLRDVMGNLEFMKGEIENLMFGRDQTRMMQNQFSAYASSMGDWEEQMQEKFQKMMEQVQSQMTAMNEAMNVMLEKFNAQTKAIMEQVDVMAKLSAEVSKNTEKSLTSMADVLGASSKVNEKLERQLFAKKEEITSISSEILAEAKDNLAKKDQKKAEEILSKVQSHNFTDAGGTEVESLINKITEDGTDLGALSKEIDKVIEQDVKKHVEDGTLPFVDSGFNSWHAPAFMDTKEKGIFQGTKDTSGKLTGQVDAGRLLNNAEMWTLGCRIAEGTKVEEGACAPKPGENFYDQPKRILEQLGITAEGNPGAPARKDEAAGIAARVAGLATHAGDQFKDIDGNNPFIGEIQALYDAGIIKGRGGEGEYFEPQQVDRATMAKIIYETTNYIDKENSMDKIAR